MKAAINGQGGLDKADQHCPHKRRSHLLAEADAWHSALTRHPQRSKTLAKPRHIQLQEQLASLHAHWSPLHSHIDLTVRRQQTPWRRYHKLLGHTAARSHDELVWQVYGAGVGECELTCVPAHVPTTPFSTCFEEALPSHGKS